MARLRNLQTNFTAGELDPKLRGRRTIKHWFNGARYLRNVILRPQGGVRRRDGGEFKGTIFNTVIKRTNKIVDGTQIAPSEGTATSSTGWTVGTQDAGLINDELTQFASGATRTTIAFRVDWGSGNDKDVTGVKMVESDSVHFLGSGADRSVTVVVQGSATGVFGGEEVTIGTEAIIVRTGFVSALIPKQIYESGMDTTGTSYRHHRVLFTWLTSASPFLAEIQFFENGEPFPLTVTAPNGGTAANVADGDTTTELTTTTNISTTDPYVVCTLAFSSARAIAFIDVKGLKLTGAVAGADGLIDAFRMQFSTDGGSNWFDYGEPFDSIGTSDVTRRKSVAAGAVTAEDWRLVRAGDQDGGTNKVTVDEIVLFEETATLSKVKMMPFKKDIATKYMCVATDRNIRIYKAGVFVADVESDILSGELAAADHVQSLDTLIMMHRRYQPRKIFRVQRDDDWSSAPQAFTNIPQFDFGDGDEDAWSDDRGWPRCATFFQDRFWMASSTSRPDTIWASKTDQLFNFDVGTGLDDEAINATILSDSLVSFHQLYAGRHLYAFGESAEFYVESSDDTIQTPENFAMRRTTQSGSKIGCEPWEVDGAILFLQRGGSVLREFIFTDSEAAYQASNVSLLSAHLLRNPVDTALRKAVIDDDADIYFVTNTDGTVATFITLRTQEINAWMMQHTEGSYRAFGVDLDDTYNIVERTIGGTQVQFLEKWVSDQLFDAAVQGSAVAATTISGLDHLNGETISVMVNDVTIGTFTVSGGDVTVPEFTGTYQAGIDFPDVTLDEDIAGDDTIELTGKQLLVAELPVEGALPDGSVAAKKKRIADIAMYFDGTRHAELNGDDLIFRALGDDILGAPVPLFTGLKREGGLLGWDLEGAAKISQDRAGEFELLMIVKEVAA